MPPELSMETLAKDIQEVKVLVAGIKTAEDEHDEKDMKAKKAQEEKEDKEKMEARKAKYSSAIKIAMDEDDHDKKDAAIRRAQEEYKNDEHKATHDNDNKHEAFGDPDKKHEAMEEEEKEHKAQIASIIKDKMDSRKNQILTAARVMNPQGLAEVEARLKTASISQIEFEYNIIKPFIGSQTNTVPIPQEKIIPFFANMTPADIDANQLSASSPDSEFNKMTTKELMERLQ